MDNRFLFKFINCTSNLTSEWNYLLYQIQYNSSNVLIIDITYTVSFYCCKFSLDKPLNI